MDSLKETSTATVMKNRNKSAECGVCGKVMREDHLQRHSKTHLNEREKEEFHTAEEPANLEEELIRYNDIYLNKLNMGKKIYDILRKGTVIEDSLPKKYK